MNLSALDLNLLKVLDALLKEKSTVKAGEKAGLSQSAVSSALGRLRNALGDPLFVREGQRLVPTRFAMSLELPLRSVLDDLQAILAGPPAFDPMRSEQSFKISGSDFFAEMLMPSMARLFLQSAPRMCLQLVDLVPHDYVDTLENHSVDLALVPETEFPPWVTATPVFGSTFVMVAQAGHARLTRAGVSPGQVVPMDLFCDLAHVVFSPQGNIRAMGDAALARLGRERRVVMTLPVFGGIGQIVAETDLVALLPVQLAERFRHKLGLEIYVPPMPLAPANISMIWHKRNSADPAHMWLRGAIAGELSRL